MSISTAEDTTPEPVTHKQMANALRALAMDAVQKANSGHPGMPMGMADVATVLFSKFLKFDPSNPTWPDRDRFILSAGHGSMLLYGLLYLTGYEKMTLEEIRNFRQLGSLTPGHPEVMPEAGIETTTGPLGQGISNAVGFAMAERILNARFGDEVVDHHTYVIASDGDLMEGVSHEACSMAGHLGLGKLIVLYDDNSISIDGSTDLSFSEDVLKRYEAYGWHTAEVDGHDPDAITKAIAEAQTNSDKPHLIACKTKIGFGAPTKEGSASSHGSPLGEEEIAGARKALDWPHEPFDIPAPILDAWREIGKLGAEPRKSWQLRLDGLAGDKRTDFDRAQSGNISSIVDPIIAELKTKIIDEQPKLATRKASGNTLDVLVPAIPSLLGGSADLTGSNNTYVEGTKAIDKDDFSGRYVHYGVREHAMAAAMNGMALHGGVIPYSGTFLTFTDYCRPSIRLSALMEQRVIYVMTHDSIGLGEDGPTHQPIEHLASLRAMPNVLVLRPADPVEVAEAWQLALENTHGPSVIALTRQGVPTLRSAHIGKDNENMSRHGAYIMAESGHGDPAATIFATGSEVEIAMDARDKLEAEGVGVRVVSVPSFELFRKQERKYRDLLLKNDSVKVGIEAACGFGWDSIIGTDGIFIGMNGFGDSAPAEDLYEHFGITADAVAEAVQKKL